MHELRISAGGASILPAAVQCERCGELLTQQTAMQKRKHYDNGPLILTFIVEPCAECIRRAVEKAKPISHLTKRK